MFDWIRSLFGKGKVRVEFKGIDRDGKLVTGDAKMPYTGKFTEEDAIAEFKEQIMYKHGIVVTSCYIAAHLQE